MVQLFCFKHTLTLNKKGRTKKCVPTIPFSIILWIFDFKIPFHKAFILPPRSILKFYPHCCQKFHHVFKRFGTALISMSGTAYFHKVTDREVFNGKQCAIIVLYLCESPIPISTKSAAAMFVEQESMFLAENFNIIVSHLYLVLNLWELRKKTFIASLSTLIFQMSLLQIQ